MASSRKTTTAFLSRLLIADRFGGIGKYWASEVSIDAGCKDGKRVDFMQFVPPNQCSVSAIEKGIFVCYEVKSCFEDVFSGNGLNFFGEKNYIVTTMECCKKVQKDAAMHKLYSLLDEVFPESSHYFGIMVAVPQYRDIYDEYTSPTPIPEDGNIYGWTLKTVLPCGQGLRKRSMTELLFCMLRSGKEVNL